MYLLSSDFAAGQRATASITPVSAWRSEIDKYTVQLKEQDSSSIKKQPTKHQLQEEAAREKQLLKRESFKRQLREWNDPEILHQNEKEFMKDPYRTIFVSRLDFSLTELDISKHFSKYGVIESVRIIRDSVTGKSRGYGFIVFEREWDAQSCISEVARTGVRLPQAKRTILVDIERGRIVLNWRPRRLGGGLGGRHYTRPDPRFNSTASAAASGRSINIANNPHIPSGHSGHRQQPSYYPPTQSTFKSYPKETEKKPEKSVKDKYAKYAAVLESSGGYRSVGETRSIRSIRQG